MLQLINPSNTTIDNANISIPPADSGTTQYETDQLEPGTTNIPSGAYSVKVFNTGLENITVNGETLVPNDEFPLESFYNEVTQRRDFCPAVSVVVPAGGSAYYVAYRPSV